MQPYSFVPTFPPYLPKQPTKKEVTRFLLPHGIEVERMSWFKTHHAAVMYVRLKDKNDVAKACRLSLSTEEGHKVSIIPALKRKGGGKGKNFGKGKGEGSSKDVKKGGKGKQKKKWGKGNKGERKGALE